MIVHALPYLSSLSLRLSVVFLCCLSCTSFLQQPCISFQFKETLLPGTARLASNDNFERDIDNASSSSTVTSNGEDIALEEEQDQVRDLSDVAKKFKILTCSSTACAKKRQNLGMDEYATYSAFYCRIKEDTPISTVKLEESPCLGACKEAPCVGVEHDDFIGNVSLLGMTEKEFSERVFHRIITEDDADRVWSCVKTGISMMAEQDEDGDDDDDDNDNDENY